MHITERLTFNIEVILTFGERYDTWYVLVTVSDRYRTRCYRVAFANRFINIVCDDLVRRIKKDFWITEKDNLHEYLKKEIAKKYEKEETKQDNLGKIQKRIIQTGLLESDSELIDRVAQEVLKKINYE